MSSNFKCLVEINGQKYSVIIDNQNNNKINFNQVYKKIQQINSKLDISFNSHLFEVLDTDFDEYVVITDDKQIIKNLSRFRVTQKQTKREDNLKLSQQIDHKSNYSKNDPSKTHNLSKESIKSISDLNQNLLENINIPKLGPADIKEFKDMQIIIELNLSHFVENRQNIGNWTRVANKMKEKHNNSKYKAKYCRQLFFNYADIYKQLLEYSPDRETAANYFPLFKLFHHINLKPFYEHNHYKQIVLLRQKFELKQKRESRLNSSQPKILNSSTCDKSPTKIPATHLGKAENHKVWDESNHKGFNEWQNICETDVIDSSKSDTKVTASPSNHLNRSSPYFKSNLTQSQELPNFIPITDSNISSKKRFNNGEFKVKPKKVKVEIIDID